MVKLTRRSYRIREGPQSKESIFVRERKGHTETEKRRCEDEGRDWSNVSTKPRNTKDCQETTRI